MLRLGGEGTWRVVVQAQAAFKGGDQGLPFFGEREGAGRFENGPGGDLPSPEPGEQAGVFDVDARVNEGGGHVFGGVFEVVGQVLAGTGGQVQVVDLVHNHEVCLCVCEDLADGIGDVGDVLTGALGQSEEVG